MIKLQEIGIYGLCNLDHVQNVDHPQPKAFVSFYKREQLPSQWLQLEWKLFDSLAE